MCPGSENANKILFSCQMSHFSLDFFQYNTLFTSLLVDGRHGAEPGLETTAKYMEGGSAESWMN